MENEQTENTIMIKSRMIEGLKQYNLTFEEVCDTWEYCGSDTDMSYFKLRFKNRSLPKHKHHCVCGHDIVVNCYITNGVEILTLGTSCVKRFVKHHCRTCEVCKGPHKNRKVNLCNDCKEGRCLKCKKPCNSKYKQCYACSNPDMVGICSICKNKCNPNFKNCYTCNNNLKRA